MTDMVQSPAGLAKTAKPWDTSVVARLLICGGAVAAFAAIALEYLKSATADFGAGQLLVVAAGFAAMAIGAFWEVRLGRRTVSETLRFWSICAVVAGIVVVLRRYDLENRAFTEFVAPLALAGFIINDHLAPQWRKAFFLALSLVTVAVVFGSTNVLAAVALVGSGLALIGICHLPIPMWGRVTILAGVAVFLAAFRLGWGYQGWIKAALPIVASIFMFRTAVYLYDIRNGKGPKDWLSRIGYFFMFPNLVFPFFPVVDFTAFGRSYYNGKAMEIYWRGASYMFRGMIHLLLYRMVRSLFVLAPDQIVDPATFLQHIVSNFALYLQISGLFHMIVGLLLLFGYNLAETHTRFYFSNSIIDFWRRINIYWKDFMQKMVFNPSYMRLKRLGLSHLASVTVSVGVVFFATWALHAYQWFWLTGTTLFALHDILFWAILAGFLIVQTLLEARPKKPSSTGPLGPQAFLVVRTLCTFLTICLLWSFWTAPSAAEWYALISRSIAPALANPASSTAVDWAITIIFLAASVFMAAIAMGFRFGLVRDPSRSARKAAPAARNGALAFYSPLGAGLAAMAVLVIVQTAPVQNLIGEGGRAVVASMSGMESNDLDAAMADRGYYEGLVANKVNNAELRDFFERAAVEDWANRKRAPGVIFHDDYLDHEFVANEVATVAGVKSPINSLGFYDDDIYTLEKPEGTFRIAVVGASRAMGWGVNLDQRFETLLEKQLNTADTTGKYKRYEILNFSVFGYTPVRRLISLETQVLPYKPDAIIYVGGLLDTDTELHADMIRRGFKMPYPFLEAINKQSGVTKDMVPSEMDKRLYPFVDEIQAEVYNRFGVIMAEHGMQGVWIEVPSMSDWRHDIAGMIRRAHDAGFVTIDLTGSYDPDANKLSRADGHPGVGGHRLLADLIFDALAEKEARGEISFGLTREGGG